MAEAERWHQELAGGNSLHAAVDTNSVTDVPALLRVVSDAIVEKRFRRVTATRTGLVLGELLANVAAHAPVKTASVDLEIHTVGLRSIELAVTAAGRGAPAGVLARDTQLFVDGDRERGLLLVARLASSVEFQQEPGPPETSRCRCVLVEPAPPPALTRRPDIGWVRLEYAVPTVFWVGRDDSYAVLRPGRSSPLGLGSFEGRLDDAVQRRSRRILDLYLGALASCRHLVWEVTGQHVGSIARGNVNLEATVDAALRLFFPQLFGERRVSFLAHDTAHGVQEQVRGRAAELGCPYFDSVEACQRHLAGL